MSLVVNNPLLHRSTQDAYHADNANASWLVAQGLVQPGDGYQPAGYTPVWLVGGISSKVHSPKPHEARAAGLSLGKKLFEEYLEASGCTFRTAWSIYCQSALPHIELGQISPQFATVACMHNHSCRELGQLSSQVATAACMHNHSCIVSGQPNPPFATVTCMHKKSCTVI